MNNQTLTTTPHHCALNGYTNGQNDYVSSQVFLKALHSTSVPIEEFEQIKCTYMNCNYL